MQMVFLLYILYIILLMQRAIMYIKILSLSSARHSMTTDVPASVFGISADVNVGINTRGTRYAQSPY